MKQLCVYILILSTLLLSACGAASAYEAPELMVPVQAQQKTAIVQRETLLNATPLTANVAIYTQEAAFVVDGTLGDVYVAPGQTVKKGDILANLTIESLQTQLEDLLEQQENTSYTNALTNQNLQIDVDICQLKLDALIQTHQAAIAVHTDAIAALEEASQQLQQSNSAAAAALDIRLKELLSQLEAPALSVEEQAALKEEITVLEQQQEALNTQSSENAEATNLQVEAIQKQIEALEATQALEQKLYELDLEDAQLAARHAKQNQAQSAKQLAAKIELLREKIDQSTLVAPMDGIVTWISAKTKITANKAYIYIADPQQRFIRTEEFSENKLKNAQRIYARIGSEEYELTYRPMDVDDRLYMNLNDITIYSLFDFESGVQVPESANALVFCVHNYKEDALSIPTTALQRDTQGYFVHRMTNGQKEQVYIKVGITTALRVEVLSGLEEGDIVYVTE